jgi:hypothetical protein
MVDAKKNWDAFNPNCTQFEKKSIFYDKPKGRW